MGSVRVIDFDRNFRSQFREGSVVRQISYQQLVKVKQLIDEPLAEWFMVFCIAA